MLRARLYTWLDASIDALHVVLTNAFVVLMISAYPRDSRALNLRDDKNGTRNYGYQWDRGGNRCPAWTR